MSLFFIGNDPLILYEAQISNRYHVINCHGDIQSTGVAHPHPVKKTISLLNPAIFVVLASVTVGQLLVPFLHAHLRLDLFHPLI